MKKPDEPLYLSASEAAAELSISPATLYAYVSRGLVRSEPTGGGARARRYRAEDVRSLKNRRAPLVETQGLKSSDLPVMDSAVSTITEEGPIYRGVSAIALAESATFEQAATLLWDARAIMHLTKPESIARFWVWHANDKTQSRPARTPKAI
jgi:citrate synthase